MKKRVITIITVFVVILALFTGCEESEIDTEYTHTAEETASYEAEPLIDTTTPISVQVLLNGRQVSLPGYAIYGRNYFRMDDIAYMLRDTLARFDFWYWSINANITHVLRSEAAFTRAGDRPASEGEPRPIQMHISTSMRVSTGGTTPRDIIAPVEAFVTESHPYFALEDLAGFLGFTMDHGPNGIIVIDTNEPNISEYGRRAAEDFLSFRPSLLDFFKLHDLNGNGIPDIFIQYAD